ncbi:MAG: tetratricopeptide repeat protein [Armatimonadetes bacterium]|nr:tetratricopeptide repeat protein [Armatimonadota bacterium]
MRSATVYALTVAMAFAVLVGNGTIAGANGFQVELVHPQSDSQGHYVGFPQVNNATVFGTLAPAGKVKAVTVDDQAAQLFPGQLAPFGAAADTPCLEFRATVELGPKSKIAIAIQGADGGTTRITLEPNADAVVQALRDAVRERPDSARDRCRLGGALRDSGKLEEAVDEFRESLKQNMSCVNTRVSLGIALVQLGRAEDALKEFAVATDTVPDYAMAWLNLGLVHARFTRNTGEAVRCFKRYLELEPNSSIADKIGRYIESHQ